MKLQRLTLRHAGNEHDAWFALTHESELQTAGALPHALLSDVELAQFGDLRFPQKQANFLIGRLAAKAALGALLKEADPRRITIASGVFGQPLVRHGRAAGMEVSLSHSQGLAVALAHSGESPLGLDLECVPAASAATLLAQMQPSAAESAWLSAGNIDSATACGLLWTAREALGKSMKIGLNCPLGTLALERIESAGDRAWSGRYANFPHSRCLTQIFDGRVLTLALPALTQIDPWPPWP